MNLKQALKNKLTKQELNLFVRSFDIIGNIAVIEIPKELEKKEKIIANTILFLFKNIRTVFKKLGRHKGKYRIQALKILSGDNNKITQHKESGVSVKLNVEKCYFSPRLSNERLRIAKQIKKDERILVMFSGIGIYSLVFAKNSKAKEIYGIELNPVAHKFAIENVKINKFENKIKFFKGDVKKIVGKFKTKFNRIIMPLPKGAEDFLENAFQASKKNTIIHFYTFAKENEFYKIEDIILTRCKRYKKKCKIINIIKCGQNAPREYRVCIDFKLF